MIKGYFHFEGVHLHVEVLLHILNTRLLLQLATHCEFFDALASSLNDFCWQHTKEDRYGKEDGNVEGHKVGEGDRESWRLLFCFAGRKDLSALDIE